MSDNQTPEIEHVYKALRTLRQCRRECSWTKSIIIAVILSMASDTNGAWDDVFKNESKATSSSRKEHKKEALSQAVDVESNLEGNIEMPPELANTFAQLKQIDSMLSDGATKGLFLCQSSQLFLINGDYVKAEEVALRGLRMAEKGTGTKSQETLTCYMATALIYERFGDNLRAIELLKSAISICNNNKSLAAEYLVVLLSNISLNELECGFLEEADLHSQKAMEACMKKSDNENQGPMVKPLYSRGKTLMAFGKYNEAEKSLKQAYDIIKPLYETKLKTGENAWIWSAYQQVLLALYDAYLSQTKVGEAKAIDSEIDNYCMLETAHMEKATKQKVTIDVTGSESEVPSDKSILAFISGDDSLARKHAHKYFASVSNNLGAALHLVESQRLGWQRKNLSFTLPVAFCTPAELTDYALQWKGVVLESIISDKQQLKAHMPQEATNKYNKLSKLRAQLSQIQLNSAQQGEGQIKVIQFLKNEIFSLEQQVVKVSSFSAKPRIISDANLHSIMSVLPDKSALIEFITYKQLPDRRLGEELFGAIVITNEASPTWVPLGRVSKLQVLLKTLHDQIGQDSTDDKLLTSTLFDLGNSVFDKIADALPQQVDNLYISPDGIVSFVPFSCLLQHDGTFILQKYSLSYVCSGRDLIKNTSPIRKSISIFANPQFDISEGKTASIGDSLLRSIDVNRFKGVSFFPLPGTEAEAEQLLEISKAAGWNPTLWKGRDATEKNLATIKSPTVLHLATHGFVLGKSTDNAHSTSSRGMTAKATEKTHDFITPASQAFNNGNSMLQSGLALAGAQKTIELWQKGEAPNFDNDGILTAEEVTGLDLNGTWLVTLSACDTAIGEVISGEGVFGLRRAFMMAGAQNLLMTLWPVSDDTTAKIMADFYRQALSTGDAAGSLAKVQRDWIVKLRNEKGILAAVRYAGPFVMATTGKPSTTKQ